MIVDRSDRFVRTLGYILFGIIFFTSTVTLGSISSGIGRTRRPVVAAGAADQADSRVAVVIDAGHGGEDGGASGADGTAEKDVNLAVAKDVDALSTLFGIPTVMTRTEDELLYDRFGELDDYTGKKKSHDLKNRLKIAEACDPDLFLSIHSNKFPDPSVRGMQVWYSPNDPLSARAAGTVQDYLNSHLQPDGARTPKKATSAIYLLKNLRTPAILVECGFLSNENELEKLKTDGYRADAACVILSSVAEYLAGNKG